MLSVKADVTDHKQVQAAVKAVFDWHKKVDVLVNSAGITGKTGIKTQDVDPENFDQVMRVRTANEIYFDFFILF